MTSVLSYHTDMFPVPLLHDYDCDEMFADIELCGGGDGLDDGFCDGFSDPLSPSSSSIISSSDQFDQLSDLDLDTVSVENNNSFGFGIQFHSADTATADSSPYIFNSVDSYSSTCSLLTTTVPCPCDCPVQCEQRCSSQPSPVLRDCMWSETSGIPIIVPINRLPPSVHSTAADVPTCPAGFSRSGSGPTWYSGAAASHIADSCAICVDPMQVFVDPRTVFSSPYSAADGTTSTAVSDEFQESEVVLSDEILYDDVETSAYSSAGSSDDELEEVDVVSIASPSSCNSEMSTSSLCHFAASKSSDQSETLFRRQMLVLPASSSMSAQVAAMHNYSTTRCRPTPPPTPPVASSSTNHANNKRLTKCAKRLVGKATTTSRRRRRNANNSGFDNSEEGMRRVQHNVMERKRRNHLRGHFNDLRDAMPELVGNKRVSKIAVLCRARDCILRLASTEAQLKAEFDKQREIQNRLKWKLSLLQRDERIATSAATTKTWV